MPDITPDRIGPSITPDLTRHGAWIVPSALNQTILRSEPARHIERVVPAVPSASNRNIRLPKPAWHGAWAVTSTLNRTVHLPEPSRHSRKTVLFRVVGTAHAPHHDKRSGLGQIARSGWPKRTVRPPEPARHGVRDSPDRTIHPEQGHSFARTHTARCAGSNRSAICPEPDHLSARTRTT